MKQRRAGFVAFCEVIEGENMLTAVGAQLHLCGWDGRKYLSPNLPREA